MSILKEIRSPSDRLTLSNRNGGHRDLLSLDFP
jgi:hypothetical protein